MNVLDSSIEDINKDIHPILFFAKVGIEEKKA